MAMRHLNGLPKIMDDLFPSGKRDPSFKLYAILDAARSVILYDKIMDLAKSKRCLFKKAEKRGLEEVAPWLVSLNLNDSLLEWIMDKGFGKSWGVFMLSKAGPKILVPHYRKLTEIRDEDGKSYIFRYYDPRVLGLFLDVCSSPERNHMLYPIRNFIMENPDGPGWRTFGNVKGAGSSFPVFDKKKEKAFSDYLERKFEERMLEEIKAEFPENFKRPGGKHKVQSLIYQGVRKAAGYGMEKERNMASYIRLMFRLGPDFELAEHRKLTLETLNSERLDENAKMGSVLQNIEIEELAGP